jgi:phage baseplate assembly protein W
MDVNSPYCFDERGRTAEADESAHARDLVEQVLFTAPGERVNRPDFGSGLLRLVFAPLSDELAATTQFLVQGSLQRWLGDIIQLEGVTVEIRDSALVVTVQYLLRRTGVRQTSQFVRAGVV